MIKFREVVIEAYINLDAYVKCAKDGVPLPDKELKNLRKSTYGYAYDKPEGGYVKHSLRGVFSAASINHYNVDHLLHNDNGPAIERANGERLWYKSGKLHREDGPAVESYLGDEYYLHGKRIAKRDFLKKDEKL